MSNPSDFTAPSGLKQHAIFLLRTRQVESARELLLDALSHSPVEAADALSDIAEANTTAGIVREILARALDAAPRQPRLWLCAGRLAINDGHFDLAIRHFFNARNLDPSNSEYALALGVALKHQNRPLEALPHLKSAQIARPSPITCRALAETEFEANHPEAAQLLFAALLASSPTDTTLRLRLAETHSQLGDNTQALNILRDGLRISPNDPALHIALAQALEDDGDSSAAIEAYLSALAIRPDWPVALAGLLGIHRGKAEHQLIEKSRAMLASPSTLPTDKALIGYALGKSLDSAARYAEAMHAWNIANQAREVSAGSFDAHSLQQHVAALIAASPPPFEVQSENTKLPRLVFIVGMPRSGTTLTERILAAHPLIHGCGELPDLPRLIHELGPDWPSRIQNLTGEQLGAMRDSYFRSAGRHADSEKTVYVDKAPLNFFQLGLIQTLFPAARVIWCRRDRRDVALSIFSENFSPGSTFATSFKGISAYQDAEDTLLALWQRTLNLPIMIQDYEALVHDTAGEAGKLLEFLDLEWDPNVLQSHKMAGSVQTPSRWQVREPVHTRSIGRWRNYPNCFLSPDS